jgi:hypothetical protein
MTTTMTPTEVVQIPLMPDRGHIWFSINLSLVDDIPALYALLRALKFEPKLAYKQTRNGIEIHLLLHHEKREELTEPANLFEQEQMILADFLPDPNAMRFTCGLTKPMVNAA